MHILREGAGKQFDPHVLEVFQAIMAPELGPTEREDAPRAGVEVS
jgi:HD-GYP domain-containing protein (c-di-GMP phosphodiesterase class II)